MDEIDYFFIIGVCVGLVGGMAIGFILSSSNVDLIHINQDTANEVCFGITNVDSVIAAQGNHNTFRCIMPDLQIKTNIEISGAEK